MPLEWRDGLSVGVVEIDKQHKELIRRINSFICCVNEGQGKDKLENLFTFMERYALTHFECEEAHMDRTAYPSKVGHVKKHQEFIRMFSLLKSQVAKDGASLHVVASAQRYLCDWVVFHVSTMDMELGKHLRERA